MDNCRNDADDVREKASGEKLYNRDELETIVESRLARERRNTESFRNIREIIAALRKNGKLKANSNAEIAEKLTELIGNKAEPDTSEPALTDNSDILPDRNVNNPDENNNQEEQKASEPKAYSINDSGIAEENKYDNELNAKTSGSEIKSELTEFTGKYGEDKLRKLIDDKAFKTFCYGKSGSLSSLYESYMSFLTALSESEDAKRYRAAEAGLASTGFSGSAADFYDYGKLLTDNQKKIAKSAGMSAKQYAELLAQIPTKNLSK